MIVGYRNISHDAEVYSQPGNKEKGGSMSRAIRTIIIVVAVVAVVAGVLFGGFKLVQRRSFPQANGTVTVPGLDAPVEVYRDGYGVPHIYASTTHDLFFAQGYAHAQDRFWQMEFWRRIGAGRLSEILGESTLSSDIYLRTMGFRRVAEQEYANLEPDERAILEAYAEGVNAYIGSRSPGELGLEFTILGMVGEPWEIEPWTPVDTLTWGKVMAQDLGGNMDDELARIDLIQEVGLEMAATFIPEYRGDMPIIVPEWAGLDTQLVGGFDPSQPLAFGRGDGIGSNNWVIAGEHTDTGMPYVANDMHLGIQMPSIWYEIALHCDPQGEDCPYNVTGFSFAGVPGVIVGHNDHIAWGVTNVGPDVQDLYIERINPHNPHQYEVDGEWVDMEVIQEEIAIQGEEEPYVLQVRVTRHGPVVTDMEGYSGYAGYGLEEGEPQITALALRWTALEPNQLYRAVLGIDRAQNFDEFRDALQYWAVPSQNFVFADVEGDIGYQMPGWIPIRAAGDGRLPVPGWTDEYEWTGYIPFEELPYTYNPAQGYVITANHAVVGPDYPYLITTEWDHGYRAARINQMVEATIAEGSISSDDIAAMQGDNLNLSAFGEVIPYLADLSFEDASLSAAQSRLAAWDGQMPMDSPEGALYGCFWVELLAATFHDELPEDLWPDGGGRSADAINGLLQDPENAWWDDITTAETETRDDILAGAFEQGYAACAEQLGDDLDSWQWGALHTATFENQTLGQCGIGLIEGIFNRGPVPVSGTEVTVNSTGCDATEGFGVTSVPSERMIVDLSDLSASQTMHTTGQSGHPGNRHYADMIDDWRFIRYHPMLWDSEQVTAAAESHLTLQPTSP
jgi:penicillin amidase